MKKKFCLLMFFLLVLFTSCNNIHLSQKLLEITENNYTDKLDFDTKSKKIYFSQNHLWYYIFSSTDKGYIINTYSFLAWDEFTQSFCYRLNEQKIYINSTEIEINEALTEQSFLNYVSEYNCDNIVSYKSLVKPIFQEILERGNINVYYDVANINYSDITEYHLIFNQEELFGTKGIFTTFIMERGGKEEINQITEKIYEEIGEETNVNFDVVVFSYYQAHENRMYPKMLIQSNDKVLLEWNILK